MKLIPVIEFESSNFQSQHDYWRNSLIDAEITHIGADQMYVGFMETSKLTPAIIRILLSTKYQINNEQPIDLETIGAMSGGYILEISKTVRFLPTCCGDLGNIKKWEIAADWMDTSEMMLWIGHPWLMVSSIDAEHLQIRQTTENGEPEASEIVVIDRSELKVAIIDAQQQLAQFKQTILIALANVLDHFSPDSPSPTAAEISELLISGW